MLQFYASISGPGWFHGMVYGPFPNRVEAYRRTLPILRRMEQGEYSVRDGSIRIHRAKSMRAIRPLDSCRMPEED